MTVLSKFNGEVEVGALLVLLATSPVWFLAIVFVGYRTVDAASFFWFHDLAAREFDRGDWLQAEHQCGSSLHCERLRMVKDLELRHKLEGMTREQVVDLLGDRYATSWAKGGYYDSNSMNYCIGETTPWETLDPWYLCLKMDPSGKQVAEYRLWEQD
ncbi:MAG: hypothetical protein K2Y22_11900 [Candidatus Obscuribacterales bacterium]|nr:hypothetical protein [Candidatus Obscuribacterales bacterium]